MAREPMQIAPMVDKSVGAGGTVEPEADSLQVELDDVGETLPEGIELDTGEQMEVMAEQYDHNANLAEVMEDGVLARIIHSIN